MGHAYSALLAFDMAQAAGGVFKLRIEDIDQSRARPAWEVQIYDDLEWLGLAWDGDVMRQSDRQASYDTALDTLWQRGLLYPCHCSRADIAAAAHAPQEGAPLLGPDGVVYPGTCRPEAAPQGPRPRDMPLRLNMALACAQVDLPAQIIDEVAGTLNITPDMMRNQVGDIVLSRRDMGTSYHLSVVLDDAAQGITHVIRGHDLLEATSIHVLLQLLMDLPTPTYHHHKLIRDDHGKRLAKRDDARAISLYRRNGATPEDIRRMVGL